jgi:plastocyanin
VRHYLSQEGAAGSVLAAHLVMSEQPSSVWVSMGLFVTTALASQVLHNVFLNTKQREKEAQNVSVRTNQGEQETNDSQTFVEDLPRARNYRYYMKRMSHVSSNEEMNFALGSSEDDGEKSQVAANMESVRNSRVALWC